jgi:hypothetical protein
VITPPPPARDDLTGAQGLANARALRETGDIPRHVARHDGRVDGRRENVSLHLAVPVAAIDRAYEQVPFEVAQRDGGRRRAADRSNGHRRR